MNKFIAVLAVLLVVINPVYSQCNCNQSQAGSSNAKTVIPESVPAPASSVAAPVEKAPVAANPYEVRSEYTVSYIDPTPSTNPFGAYYPGLRGGNQLNVYTPRYGVSTGTNEYGREAVVVNGVVTDLTGSDTVIPANGYVISGHGTAKNFITANLMVGSRVYIDVANKKIVSIITPESYIFRAENKINDVVKILAGRNSKKNTIKPVRSDELLNEAMAKLITAKNYMKAGNYQKAIEMANQASIVADNSIYYAVSPKAGEFKGIWLRPVEKNRESIALTLDKIKSSGINNVFVETYYHGSTIFPSKTLAAYGIQPQKKEFVGWDPLAAWVEEAHKRNMKVHVWFQTFYAGNENIAANPTHVLSVHPEWANVQYANYAAGKPMYSISEHNGYFLDPANPEVRKYVTALLTEIANNYDVDGLNIDYIRYPASLLPSFPNYLSSTWGYSLYARNEFEQLYGVDPVNLSPSNPEWQKWVEYRQSKVTELVSSLRSITAGKNIKLTAVIFPNAKEGPIVKNQNWMVWGQNKYVDSFTPLILGSDELSAGTYVQLIKSQTYSQTPVYAGLFQPFTGGSPVDMLKQINAARSAGAEGIILFDYAHLSPEFQQALRAGAFAQAVPNP